MGADLYERDFYAWTRRQAEALRRLSAEHWNGPLDLQRLAEEVEDLGSSQRHAAESQIERVIEHLLKLEYSPSSAPRRQWLISVANARGHVAKRLTASMRQELQAGLAESYRRARRRAVLGFWDHGEIDEAAALLPETCPYTLDEIVDEDWLPASQHGHAEAMPTRSAK
jgi:hypothetical protein